MLADGRVGPAEGAFTNCTSMLACFALGGGERGGGGGGALLRQLKLVRTPGPGSLTVLGVGPPTPWKLACTTTNGWFQQGNALADRMR